MGRNRLIDCSLPLTGFSLLEGRVQGSFPQKETGTVSRRAVNSGLGTNPLVFNTETQGVPRNVYRRSCGPGEPHHPTLGPELA